MYVKTIFSSCSIVTKLTTIFNPFMDRLYMYVKTAFSSCFIVAILTTVFNPIMDRLYMYVKTAFSHCLIVAILATALYSSNISPLYLTPLWIDYTCMLKLPFFVAL